VSIAGGHHRENGNGLSTARKEGGVTGVANVRTNPFSGGAGFSLIDFYHNELRLLGLDTFKLGFAEAAAILRQLAPGFESGEFPASDCQPFPSIRRRKYIGKCMNRN
jgi:hypothetical protein